MDLLVVQPVLLVRADVSIQLREQHHQSQLRRTDAGAGRIAGQDLQPHLQIGQRNRRREDVGQAERVGGVREDVVKQPDERESRNRGGVHLDTELVGNNVRHTY